jgi:glycine/D-amino acid oxidase-like deaminating enzyme
VPASSPEPDGASEILDPETDRGQAWRAAAGMLAPQIEAREGDALFELGLAGREFYADLAPALEESTGINIGLWREGSPRSPSKRSTSAACARKVAWQRQQGHLCDWLDAAEVKERWPWIGQSHGALWAAREGALDPQVWWRRFEPTRSSTHRVDPRRSGGAGDPWRSVVAVEGRARRYPTEHVVLAAGAWSGTLEGLPGRLGAADSRPDAIAAVAQGGEPRHPL